MTDRKPYQCITAQAAGPLLARAGALVFDVRDHAKYDAGHIPGARHLTMDGFPVVMHVADKSAPIVIYCNHGHASREFAQMFTDFGFQDVTSLDGGYEAWRLGAVPAKDGPPSKAMAAWLADEGFATLHALAANQTTALMRACQKGELAHAREALARGVSLHARNADGNNALWLACAGEKADAMTFLIDAGIDMDNQNDNGATVLMYASSSGKPWAVKLLLEAGADAALQSLDGMTALDMASTIQCLELLRWPKARAAGGEA